jgi:hypothetical protein
MNWEDDATWPYDPTANQIVDSAAYAERLANGRVMRALRWLDALRG